MEYLPSTYMERVSMDKKNTLKQHVILFKFCWSIAPGFMIFNIFEAIKLQISIFFEHSFGIRYIIKAAEQKTTFLLPLYYLTIMMIAIAISTISFAIFNQWITPKYKQKIYLNIKMLIFNTAVDIDIKNYDNPSYYNEFILSISESEKCIDRFIQTISTFFSDLTSIICFSIYLLYLDKGGIVFVSIVFVSSMIISHFFFKIKAKERLERIPIERKQNYLQRLFYLKDYAKDIRLYSEYKDILINDLEDTNNELQKINLKYEKKRFLIGFLKNYGFGDFIMCSLYTIYLAYQAIYAKNILYSDMVILFMMARSFSGWFISMAETYPRLTENAIFIKKIVSFISHKTDENVNMRKMESISSIDLVDVSFGYEDHLLLLKKVKMHIVKGQKVAIVGNNGAGKSTLVSLIAQLYEPQSGKIMVNGYNIIEYNKDDLKKKIGVILQDFNIYAMSIRENILMSDNEEKDMEILNSLNKINFLDNKRNYTLNKQLLTEFEEDGIDLSGGEKQKIAIARALMLDSDIIIMDEPSSALDPIAEYNFNQLIKEISKEKIVIFISHRLSTTREADYIYVMEEGEIKEEGSHEGLLSQQGIYCNMWNVQAGKYQ